MHKTRSTLWRRYGAIVTSALVLMALAGCQTTSDWLKGRKTHDAAPVILGAPGSGQYVTELYDLVSGDPATQAEIYADARSGAQLTPDPSTRLRYALVLAAPGHAESNEMEAQSLLRALLAQTELLTPTEISLATIHLEEVEERLILGAEARTLRSRSLDAASTEDAAVAQRVATIESENRRLRRLLADAEQKLAAITSIERSVRDAEDSQ